MKSPELIAACRELRKNQTKAEALLWSCLRNRQLNGYKFRRQHPVEGFILDFFCPDARLAIELDGAGHRSTVAHEYDAYREQVLRDKGIHVLRFWNSDVEHDLEKVILRINAAISKQIRSSKPDLSSPH